MDAIEDIKSRLNIEDVISEYVQLKRAGRNFKGLSPFSSEKTPSFMVSPEKQIWHDFSSGKGGNVFSFVMEMEGLDFKAALELLARKAGVDLSQYQTGNRGSNAKQKERLLQVLELATKFYQVQFSKNQLALEYVFKQRNFSKDIALTFRLGYAPNTGTALYNFLKKQQFTDQEMQKAGLVSLRFRRANDMFRGRLMVPLMDAQGQVIGFTARLLDDQPDAPKYINTPQTLLYDKGRHIFGLHLAKERIRKEKYAVVVEGNLDVIAAHQAGTHQVVATAGTALTEMHLKGISRLTTDVRLCFDQDGAGQAAAERAIPIASKTGVSLSILTLPSGKDPDELIQKNPKAWQELLNQPDYALDWLINRYKSQLDISSASGKRTFTDLLLGTIKNLSDRVEQDHYITKVAELIGVSREALVSKMAHTTEKLRTQRKKREQTVSNGEDTFMSERIKIQEHLLALCLFQPAVRLYAKPITPAMLIGSNAQTILDLLDQSPEFKGSLAEWTQFIEAKQEADGVQNLKEYVKILSLQFEELYHGLELLELRDEAARLQARLIEHYVKSRKQALAEAMHEADEAKQDSLLKEVKQLDELLKNR